MTFRLRRRHGRHDHARPQQTASPAGTVHSAGGTAIAYDRTGDGPALVLVVGAFCDRTVTRPLTALLAPRFTVYEYDRHGAAQELTW